MATAVFIAKPKPETELTSTLSQTSDQNPVPNDSSLTDIPSPVAHISETQVETPHSQQDAQSPKTKDSTTDLRDCEILDVKSSPQFSQRVGQEIKSDDTSDGEQHPRIEAVWSICQEHSYELNPDRCRNDNENNTEKNARQLVETQAPCSTPTNDNASSKQNVETKANSVETYITPQITFTDDSMSTFIKAQTASVPKIIKIQTKSSKKHTTKDSLDYNGKQSKYLTLHSTKSRSYKTLRVLQLPKSSHGDTHPSWNNCLIDHNLKPLQIQHNLENKNKSLAVLKLETLSLKYDDSKESIQYPYISEPGPSPPSHFIERGNGDKFMSNNGPINREEEVGMDSVYIDVDQNPSNSFDLSEIRDNSLDTDYMDPMLDQCSLNNLSMGQYLPDFSDLPQFQNIPMDTQDDPCAEPTQLTPSIDHNLLDYDWPSFDPAWYNSVPTLPATAAKPQTAATVNHSEPLNEFLDTGIQQAEVSVSSRGVPRTITAMTKPHIDSFSNPMLSQLQSPAAAAAAPALSSTITSTIVHMKMEEESWNQSEDCRKTTEISDSMQPTTNEEAKQAPLPTMASDGQPLKSNNSQSLTPDNPFSTALMAALDMDSHQTNLVELQTNSPAPDSQSSYHYLDPNSQGMGCSSTFLSPPPSVEPQASQRSTPCMDNDSGYMTMEEQELQSPGNLYWQQHQHYPSAVSDDTDNSYTQASSHPYSGNMASGYGDVGGYPYTHQDSHHQTLHQTASCSMPTTIAPTNNNIIYYPFNDLMQLNPNLLSSDPEMSVQYVHNTYPTHNYPQQTLCETYSDQATTQTHVHQPTPAKKRGRGGRPRGGRQTQIQSDQITTSLQHQLQVQIEPPPKRQYKRRSAPDTSKKSTTPKIQRSISENSFEKKGRHNEPLNQRAVDIMHDWYKQHEENPYPTKEEKECMAVEGGITTMQVKSWFANKRNRSNNTRPKVQKRAMEEKLMQIYNQLSKTDGTSVQEGSNSLIIKELSQIIHNKLEADVPESPESST